MSTANSTASGAAQQLIDQRLDAIDRALLGLVPRGERLAMVAQVESRIRDLAAEVPTNETSGAQRALALSLADVGDAEATSALDQTSLVRRSARATGRKLSRLALAAGVLGIMAIALFFLTPIIYFLVAMVGDMTDEVIAIGLLGTHTVAVAVGGLAAVALGFAALMQLRRRSRNLAGYGWAITGLCTGPMPMLVGGLVILVVGVQLLGSSVVRVQMQSSDSPTTGAVIGTPVTEPSTISEKVAQGGNAYKDVAPARHEASLEDSEPRMDVADEQESNTVHRSARPQLSDDETSAPPAPLPQSTKPPASAFEPSPPPSPEKSAEELEAR